MPMSDIVAAASAARSEAHPTVLVLNAGSSSIKFAVYRLRSDGMPQEAAIVGQVEGLGTQPRLTARCAQCKLETIELRLTGDADAQHAPALSRLLRRLEDHDPGVRIVAAGHRVVHGGTAFVSPTLIDSRVFDALYRLVPLAPLHQPHNLAAIGALRNLYPDLPQVACFDTAFHAAQPDLAQQFALPRALTARGIRRYGFHGLSYESVLHDLRWAAGERAKGRVIVAHLGNGASMCAMLNGVSVASSMGFTAVDGLMMGTRTGNLDPGVLLYLMQQEGWDAARLERLLYRESGLLGVSGVSSDMRVLLASENPAAHEAVELFCYRAVREIGSLAAALGGLDLLVFTGGIGQHAAPVRARIANGCAWLGIELDAAANTSHGPWITTPRSTARGLVIATDEERTIARHTAALLRDAALMAASGARGAPH
jgi:acetate kinase